LGEQNTFLGANYILVGKDFCFYYMFKTSFSGRKKIGGTAPECPRRYGPGLIWKTTACSAMMSLFPPSRPHTTVGFCDGSL